MKILQMLLCGITQLSDREFQVPPVGGIRVNTGNKFGGVKQALSNFSRTDQPSTNEQDESSQFGAYTSDELHITGSKKWTCQ